MNSRIALITGAAKGIGLATAKLLAREGFHVILAGRGAERMEAIAGGITGEGALAEGVDLDVADLDSIKTAADLMGKRHGRLDVLVNNAAILLDHYQQASSTSKEVLEQTLKTNVIGPHAVIRTFLPLLRKSQSGRIVNVSSGGGQLADMLDSVWAPAYQISKTAVNALTRLWAAELRKASIAVFSVCPGWCRTEMGGAEATRSAEQGAESVAWAVLKARADQTGGFFRDGQPLEW